MSEVNPNTPADKQRLINISCFIVWFVYLFMQTGLLWWMGWGLDAVINDSLISASILAGLAFVLSHGLNAYLPSGKFYLQLAIITPIIAALSVYASQWLIGTTLNNAEYLHNIKQSLPVRFCFQVLLLGWVAAFNMHFNIQAQREENERQRLDIEKITREAELYNLRQQLQPHFLFNSLNSIMALILKQPEKAQDMIVSLAAFLRGTLRLDAIQLSTLAEEMEQLALYLEIEKVRFGHRLEVNLMIEPQAKEAKLPSMILQPLLENAIKFGLYDTTGIVNIQLHTELLEDGMLYIELANPYNTSSEVKQVGTGFGLRGVKRRLFLIYGRTDLITVEKANEIFKCQLRIPQIEGIEKGLTRS